MLEGFLTYGLVGLFLSAFLGSTIFIPLTPELFVVALVGAGANPFVVVFLASVASLLGNVVNYAIGFYCVEKLLEKFVKREDIKKAEKIADKYGAIGIFLSMAIPLPLPVDVLAIIAGTTKMKLRYFLLACFFGKLIKYSFYAGITEYAIKMFLPSVLFIQEKSI